MRPQTTERPRSKPGRSHCCARGSRRNSTALGLATVVPVYSGAGPNPGSHRSSFLSFRRPRCGGRRMCRHRIDAPRPRAESQCRNAADINTTRSQRQRIGRPVENSRQSPPPSAETAGVPGEGSAAPAELIPEPLAQNREGTTPRSLEKSSARGETRSRPPSVPRPACTR